MELPLYQGAMPQAPQMQRAKLPQLPRMQMCGGQLDNAINAGLDALDKYATLHDFGVRQESEHQMRQNELEMQQEFERRSALAPGAEDSFFNEDGTLNEDAVAGFTYEYQEKNREVARPYLKRGDAMRAEEQVLVQNDRMASSVGLGLVRQESRNRAQAFQENFDLAVAQDDLAGAARIVDDAVASGQITGTKGKVMKLGLARKALRAAGGGGADGEGPSITVDGVEYTGFSAALAAQGAKDGWKPESAQGRTQEPLDSGREEPIREGAVAALPEPPDTLTAHAVTPYDELFVAGDFGKVLPAMPQADVSAFTSDVMGAELMISSVPREDGSMGFTCSTTAPEVVERATAHATAMGGLTPDDARQMVAAIAMDMFSDNADISPAAVKNAFEKSGVFEALGDGDADVGAARVEGIVKEIQSRSKDGTTQLGMEGIKRMVDAHIASNVFRVDGEREWYGKNWAKPYYNDKGEYEKPETEGAALKRWQMWRDLYVQYRPKFYPNATGEVTDEEFAQHAGAFYEKYMKYVYTPKREADAKAARDWYVAEITTALMENMGVDPDGKVTYGSYASDIAVARDVLRRVPPGNNGVDALMEKRQREEDESARRSESFRMRAQGHYEKLKAAKAGTAEAAKAKEQAEKAKEKEEKAAEEAERKKQVHLLNVERNRPREAGWRWDGKPAAIGAEMSCTLPEGEYQELFDKLGYDGTQTVYVQIQGAKFKVTGTNKTGDIQLNAPAVAKLQGKRKKGDKLIMGGRLGYSYYFKTINNQ